jgi:hypothetical protein
MVCSGPEGLKHADLNVTLLADLNLNVTLLADLNATLLADLNVTLLWTAIQILQFFITWISEPSQIKTPHY